MKDKEKDQDLWEQLERLSVKDLRRQAAINNVPLTQISLAIEKSDLINLIIKAGPVLDQYDVNLGVKVWNAESIEKKDPLIKGPKPRKEKKKAKKQLPMLQDIAASSSDSGQAQTKKKKEKRDKSRKRSRSKKAKDKKRQKGRSRSPSLTMMLPADAPAVVDNPEAAMQALLPKTAVAAPPPLKALRRTAAADEAVAVIDDDLDDDVVACISETPAAPLESAEGSRGAQIRAARKAAAEKAVAAKASGGSEPPAASKSSVAVAELARRGMAQSSKGDTTVEAGVAAAAALGFSVVPQQKQSALAAAPAEGLRPSLWSVPAALAPGKEQRVCVQFLCFARCKRGTNCPEAHIMDPEEEMRVRAKFKLQECNQGASCTKKTCLFRHPGERVEESHPTNLQFF